MKLTEVSFTTRVASRARVGTHLGKAVKIEISFEIVSVLARSKSAKRLKKTHDPFALVAHTSSSSRAPPAYYVTHLPYVVDYDDEYHADTFQNDPEDSLTFAMMLLARAITQRHYARNFSKPRVRDSKYFMEQMLLAKKDKTKVILSNEQNDFLIVDDAQMVEIEELSANICMMARIQNSAFISECYNCSEKGHYARNFSKPRVRDSKYFMEQMLLAKKDKTKRCHKQCIDFELQLQHQKENNNCESSLKNLCKTSWILKMEKLENKNVYFEFQIQSLMKERENIKLEYQKLYDSIKKTCTQTQREINELIENVNQKTCAYADVRAKNQDLLITISELKAKLKNVEKGKSVNTKFDKPLVSSKLLCVTPINKQVIQKKKFVLKIKEKHVLTKPVTLQTSHTKKKHVHKNTNVIAPSMYEVNTANKQEVRTKDTKSVLTSTSLKEITSVRRLSSRSSSPKNNVISNTKNQSEYVDVHVRKNKNTNVASKKNVVHNKKIVTNVDVKTALKAKDVLCVSCDKNVLTSCHDKCLVKYMLDVNSKVRRSLFTTPRTAKSKSLDTTHAVTKTRFAVVSPLSAKLKIVYSSYSKHMTGNLKLLKNLVEKFIGIVRFGNSHFTAITGYGDYVHGNITICHVYYVKGLEHNLFSVGQFCDGDLEVAFRSNTCNVRNLEGGDLLTDFDGNTLFTPYDAPTFEEAESSSIVTDPSNMHEFNQVQPSTHIWTKAHPLEQVIGDPSKLVMTRSRLQTDAKVCIKYQAIREIKKKGRVLELKRRIQEVYCS
nr:integrase, catalytic region, zinc finger, CCHC-type, peptidase aspartic, catalytic [Tanacetum cinerariifolium]